MSWKQQGWFKVCIRSPKQCIQVTNPCSTLQETLERLNQNKLVLIEPIQIFQPLPLSHSQNIGSQAYTLRREIKRSLLGEQLQKKKSPTIYLKGPPAKSSADNPVKYFTVKPSQQFLQHNPPPSHQYITHIHRPPHCIYRQHIMARFNS